MRKSTNSESNKPRRPGLTIDSRTNQVINAAVNLAEQQILDGTASPSVIVHYLKLGSPEKRLELEAMKNKNELLKAKTEMIKSAKRIEELYADAIAAMRSYGGEDSEEDLDEDEYDD